MIYKHEEGGKKYEFSISASISLLAETATIPIKATVQDVESEREPVVIEAEVALDLLRGIGTLTCQGMKIGSFALTDGHLAEFSDNERLSDQDWKVFKERFAESANGGSFRQLFEDIEAPDYDSVIDQFESLLDLVPAGDPIFGCAVKSVIVTGVSAAARCYKENLEELNRETSWRGKAGQFFKRMGENYQEISYKGLKRWAVCAGKFGFG